MRDIKFRVWDNNCEQYCDEPGYIVVFGGGNFQMFNDSEGDWEENGSNGSDLALEQYTGLKDKNGVEIYEGDIIKLGDDTYDYWYDKGELVQVCWKRETCGFKPFCDTHSDYNLINNKTCEIIGNIHENEDLLK